MAQMDAAGDRTSHVRRKRERRREEVLHAALRAFREKGYHGASLADIAGELGLQKTALYHYFPDKEAILCECHRRSLDALERAMDEASGSDSASGALLRLLREHIRIVADTFEGSTLAFEVPALSPHHQREIVARRDAYERGIREIISRGVETGEFRAVDPKIAAFALLGSLNWIARWYRPEGELGATELAVEFSAHLVGGLAAARTADGAASPPQGGAADTRRSASPE